jgi:hypothetical protein
MNTHHRLRELESELLEMGCRVRLKLTRYGVAIESRELVDRLIARKELIARGIVLDESPVDSRR